MLLYEVARRDWMKSITARSMPRASSRPQLPTRPPLPRQNPLLDAFEARTSDPLRRAPRLSPLLDLFSQMDCLVCRA